MVNSTKSKERKLIRRVTENSSLMQ